MGSCAVCGEAIDGISGYSCSYCPGSFCSDHRLPENHGCTGLRSSDTLGPNFEGPHPDEEPDAAGDPGSSSGGSRKTPCEECGRPCPPDKTYCSPCQKDIISREKTATREEIAQHWRDSEGSDGDGGSGGLPGVVAIPLGLALIAISAVVGLLRATLGLAFSSTGAVMVFVVLPLAIVGAVSMGVVTSGDVAGTPAEPLVAGIEGELADAHEATTVDGRQLEAEIAREVNDRRAVHGLDRLDPDSELADVARAHSADMAIRDFYAHENPDGEGPQERASGVCRATENINKVPLRTRLRTQDGETTRLSGDETEIAEHVVDQWMNSEGHRRNILDGRVFAQGIGVHVSESDDLFATQMLCVAA